MNNKSDTTIALRFKGIIFDLDGTLVDSLEDLADSMNGILQRYGFPVHDLQTFKGFIGRGMRNLVARSLPGGIEDEELITECHNLMVEEYGNNCTNKTRPYDGIADMLDGLAARRIRLAIFSNKTDILTKKVATALLSKWKFEAMIGSGAGLPEKPDPSGALMISRQMGISPENLIYSGDSGIDMQTANNAGMCAVGVLWGFRTKEELLLNGAKYLLEHPMDMLRFNFHANSGRAR